MNVVLYHASCADGFGAAWAAHKFINTPTLYFPVQYGSPPPEDAFKADNLLIVDFSYPIEDLRRLADAVKYMRVIDHHKTAEETLRQFNRECGDSVIYSAVFDLDKSGAVLTWQMFFDEPVPILLLYVQDRDLWQWKLPCSKEFSAALQSYPFLFNTWDKIHSHCEEENSGQWLVPEGQAILRYQQQQVDSHVKKAVLGDLAGYQIPIVNATTLQSEIGHALNEKFADAPFSASYFIREDDKKIWSLRSSRGFDVGALAKTLGGGGHPAAAGFEEKC